ncbi:MAG: nucleotide exchange factor GrpE [Flavobacteriaceae bacterium]|mgnify:FL=1|nr:nucleotide exchange factor GrpE [Flavobacteriaceae bacterium]MBT7459152.1 nucleotide exchange factor GrpE [Flavobacteriaceae bacterium]
MAKTNPKKSTTKTVPKKKDSSSDFQKKIDELQSSVDKEKDQYLRLFAEFENYKKRTSKERIDLFKTAAQELVTALLPVVDDFERALVELKKSDDADQQQGVELIYNKLSDTLRNQGLSQMEVGQGDDFDAELHEAITQIPAPEEKLKGKIVDVVGTGYKLGDKIIRYPKVVVGN